VHGIFIICFSRSNGADFTPRFAIENMLHEIL